MMKIIVEPDIDPANPLEILGLKLYSFSWRHSSYADPADLGVFPTRADCGFTDERARSVGEGSSVILSYYEHGSAVWGLPEEVPYCRFDTVPYAGLLEVQRDEIKALEEKERLSLIRTALKRYNNYCMGECFTVFIEQTDGSATTISAYGKEEVDAIVAQYKDRGPSA
jgi:hypothetical protein